MSSDSSSRLEMLPRLGYAARGIVYLIVGGFAVLAAIGGGRETPDAKGALQIIFQQPLGSFLLGAVAAGLVAFAAWRIAQSLLDADNHGNDSKGLTVRIALFISALAYLGLALFATSLIFRWNVGGDGSTRDWTIWLFRQPFGQWLVGAVGAVVVATGLAVAYKGAASDVAKRFDMDDQDRRWAAPVSRFGLIARGAVFLIIGGFLVAAAVHASPSEAGGLGEALRWIQQQRYGPWLLAILAVGLVAFGAYSLIEARYRRIAYGSAFPARLSSAVPP